MKPLSSLLVLVALAACADPAAAPLAKRPNPALLRFDYQGKHYILTNGDSNNTWPPEVVQALKLATEGTGSFDAILASPRAREALQRVQPKR